MAGGSLRYAALQGKDSLCGGGVADPIDAEAADDSGSVTLERYEYQVHVAVQSVLQMLAGGPVRHVTCEHIEDIVVATTAQQGGATEVLWDFQQIKTKDAPAPWTLAAVIKKGPLRSLWRTHLTVRSCGISYQLSAGIEGVLDPQDAVLLALSRGQGGGDEQCRKRVAEHLGADEEEVASFLSLVRVRPLHRRVDLEQYNCRFLGSLNPDLTVKEVNALYLELLRRTRDAMQGRLGFEHIALVIEPEPGARIRNKRIDAARIDDIRRRLCRETVTGRSAGLDTYLEAARSSAGDHPYAGVLPGAVPSLAKVYLPQQISRRSVRSDSAEPSQARAHDMPADRLLQAGSCIVVSGPGGGKSSLLRSLLVQEAARIRDGQVRPAVPVLVSAAALDGAPLAKALATAVNRELGGLVDALPVAFFSTAPAPGASWLILIDGLDEVTDSAVRVRVLKRVAEISGGRHAGLYRFIIATRPLPSDELKEVDFPLFDLLPFHDDDLPTVAARWFRTMRVDKPESVAQRFLDAVKETGLRDLARIPLMTAMLCQIYATRPEAPLPSSRGSLYGAFVDLLHKNRHTQGGLHASKALHAPLRNCGSQAVHHAETVLARLADLIGYLAAERYSGGNNMPPVDILLSHPDVHCPPGVLDDEWRSFLHTALARSGLLADEAGELVFLHHTLMEYLAARHYVRDRKTGSQALQRLFPPPRRYWPFFYLLGIPPRLWFRRYWEPPTGQVSYAGFLLDVLAEEDPDIRSAELDRLAARGGLDGWTFIVELSLLGTTLPHDAYRKAITGLRDLATQGTPSRLLRTAVHVLGALDQSRFAGLLIDLHINPDRIMFLLVASPRLQAAEQLIPLGDPSAPDPVHALALDTTLHPLGRAAAMLCMAEEGDPRAPDLAYALATDADLGKGIFIETARLFAAQALGMRNDPRANDLLRTIAEDTSASRRARATAAHTLFELDDPGAADLAHRLTQDTSLHPICRVAVSSILAELGDLRAPDVLRALADNPSLGGRTRLTAARSLAELEDPHLTDILRRLARDRRAGWRWRRIARAGLVEISQADSEQPPPADS